MSDISNQLIKDSYNYVLQSDLATGIVYRIGGVIPVNPIFQSAITVNSGFTYTNGTEQPNYVLTTDGTGYAFWAPVSGTSPSSGVTSITVGNGLSANSSTGAVTIVFTGSIPTQGITGITGTSGVSAITTDYGTIIINTNPDKTVVITGGTGIQIISDYPNFGVNYTGQTSFPYLPLSGGTVTGNTVFTSGLTANTVSATTYQNLPSSFQSVRINGVTQFSANTGNFINFVGTNITIQSAATNTISLIVTPPTIPPTTTLIGSGSFRYQSNGNFLYGASSSLGWNSTTWNLSNASFPTSLTPGNINNLIPLPKDLSIDDEITICGVVYLNGADTRHSITIGLGLVDCKTITGGRAGDPVDITQIGEFRGQSFADNGFCCFTGTVVLTDALPSCETFILIAIQDDRANSNIASVTFTLSSKSY